MKHLLLIAALLPALAMAQFNERQTIYNTKDNVLTISHNVDKLKVLRNWKLLLSEQMYTIKTYDTDIFVIQTEYKTLKNNSTRLHVMVKDSVILVRGWSTNGISVNMYGVQTSPAELQNEYRATNITIMAAGFSEMDRIAMLYKQRWTGSLGSYRE